MPAVVDGAAPGMPVPVSAAVVPSAPGTKYSLAMFLSCELRGRRVGHVLRRRLRAHGRHGARAWAFRLVRLTRAGACAAVRIRVQCIDAVRLRLRAVGAGRAFGFDDRTAAGSDESRTGQVRVRGNTAVP